MFWGITLDGGKRYSQTVERPFHLSMAALECNSAEHDKTRAVQVMVQHESAEFLLCTLCPFSLLQQQLDLTFSQGEEVTFFLNGIGVVHLTGSLLEEESEPLEDNFEDDGSDLDIPQLQEIDDYKVNTENDRDFEPKPSGTKRKMNETITHSRKKRNKSMAEKQDKFDQPGQDDSMVCGKQKDEMVILSTMAAKKSNLGKCSRKIDLSLNIEDEKGNSLGMPNIQEQKKKKKKKKKKYTADTGDTKVEVMLFFFMFLVPPTLT